MIQTNMPEDMDSRNALILAIKNAIESRFSASEWKEIGYMTQTQGFIDEHPRLLRSLRWRDPDYPGHIFDTIEEILRVDSENLQVLLDYGPVKEWMRENEPDVYEDHSDEVIKTMVESPSLKITSDVVERAIDDAETLITSNGATSGVDRVHTTLHGYLIAICDDEAISYPDDASITRLFKNLKNEHPALEDIGPRASDLIRILNSFSAVIDALNPIRNRASVAHPNEELLKEAEAILVINAARTILHYLDKRLSSSQLREQENFSF